MQEALPTVPVTVLTGFLGAGKTTLLNRILSGDHGLRVAALVNDFGEINIDAELVVGVEEDLIALANGCVCCQVRDDLIQALSALLQRSPRPEHLILEASGVADPMSLVVTFQQQQFHDRLRLDGVITVVDAEQFFDDEALTEYKLRQIVCADLAVLNKADLVGESQLTELVEWIDNRARRIRCVVARYGDVPLEVLLGAGAIGIPPDGPGVAPDHAARFATWSFESDHALRLADLSEVVTRLPASIYRMKGVVASTERPDHRTILQVVGRRASLDVGSPWGDRSQSTRIVAIGAAGSLPSGALASEISACAVPR